MPSPMIKALERAAKRTKNHAAFMRSLDVDDLPGWVDQHEADAARLRALARYMTEEARLVKCEACDGEGGWPDGDPLDPQGAEAVGCQYCETTGKVIVLPATLLTEEAPDARD